MTHTFLPKDASGGRARWANPALLACLLVLLAKTALGAAPVYHENYDLVQTNPTAIHALYQALCDDANRSLAKSIEARHEEAIEAAEALKGFVVQLGAFRDDIANRGLDAIILLETYSTVPLVALSKSCQSVAESHRALNESLTQALNATGPSVDARIRILVAEKHLADMNVSVWELESSVRSLPPFIHYEHLLERLAELRALLAIYSAMLGDLEPAPAILLTALELLAQPDQLLPGENVTFRGALFVAGGAGLPGENVHIEFLSTVSTVQTSAEGAFQAVWPIPGTLAPGIYPARAYFDPPPASNYSPCSSNVVYVTVIGGARMRTSLTLRASHAEAGLGQTLSLSGRLQDEWGRGVPGREVLVESDGSAIRTLVQTDDEGYYLARVTPSSAGTYAVHSAFRGDGFYLPCTSPPVSIHVLPPAQGTEPLATRITIMAPPRTKAGDTLSITGILMDMAGIGLPGRTVLVLWDGLPKWSTTTDHEGSFSLNPLMSKDETGLHRLMAAFEPDDRTYSGSRSREIQVEVWAAGVLWIPIMLSVAAIGMILAGLAFARGVRPHIVQRHGGRPGGTTLESPAESMPEPVTPASHGAASTHRRPRTLQGMVSRGGEALLRAYAELVELISRVLLIDLANKTHTEILSLARVKGMKQSILEPLRTATEIYEKAAFSGRRTEPAEQREFYRALGAVRSSLQGAGGQ